MYNDLLSSDFVLWCEDCIFFVDVGPDGEGTCSVDGHPTWYGCPKCVSFSDRVLVSHVGEKNR